MRWILLGTVCPNNLCSAFVVPLLHQSKLDLPTMSWELECPFCQVVFRIPDDKLTQSEVSPEWIQRAMQARDARAAKLRRVRKALWPFIER